MAQEPDKPKDSGKIGLPKVDAGMNRIAPKIGDGKDGKGKSRKPVMKEGPPLSETNFDEPENPEEKEPEVKGTTSDDVEPLTDEEKQKLLARIRKRMDRVIAAEGDNRKAALDDLKFIKGDQWPADVQAQRNFDKRPCLTVNKLPTFIHQVTNDQRQNRPAINVSPVGDKGDVEVAKMYSGLIRAIERASTADIAYDTAFQSAVSNGFGYFRILTEYEEPESFDQVLSIRRIRNPFTVYLDDGRMEPDGSDSQFGFVTEMIPRSEFEEKWPDADPMPFNQGAIGENFKNWQTKDDIRIAEYYELEMKMKKVVKLSTGATLWEEDISDEVWDSIDSGEVEIVKERMAESPVVHWYRVTAVDVLEHGPTVFKWIPIIPVIGDEIDIEGKVTYSGITRNAKDPQRMFNYWRTSSAELIALAPKSPWVMEEGQVEGHEARWKQSNVKSYPYLLYKAVNVNGVAAPAPQRQPFAGVPGGVTQAAVDAAQDMMGTTGIRFDATMQERTTDESGRAMRELRRAGDIGSFHYIDNLSRSLKHCGRILVDSIPKVYDTKRMLTILREDGVDETVQINPDAPKGVTDIKHPATGKTTKMFNPTLGKYGVTVTIGPSYATKRIEAAESMMDFARALPATAGAIADLIAKNQDWPGANEMATRLAKVVAQTHPGVMTPDMKDVPPQVQAMLSQLDMQVKQLLQERVQLTKLLQDKTADRQVDLEKINRDFEAKLFKIVSDIETKNAAIQQKAIASFESHISAELKALGGEVTTLLKSVPSVISATQTGENPGA